MIRPKTYPTCSFATIRYRGVHSLFGLCPTRNQPDDIEFLPRKLVATTKTNRSSQIGLG